MSIESLSPNYTNFSHTTPTPPETISKGWRLLRSTGWLIGKATELIGKGTSWSGKKIENWTQGSADTSSYSLSSLTGKTIHYTGKLIEATGQFTESTGQYINPYSEEESLPMHGPLTLEESHLKSEETRIQNRSLKSKTIDTGIWLSENSMRASSYLGRQSASVVQFTGKKLDELSSFPSGENTSNSFVNGARILGKVGAYSLYATSTLLNTSAALGEWSADETRLYRGDLTQPIEGPTPTITDRIGQSVRDTAVATKELSSQVATKTLGITSNLASSTLQLGMKALETGATYLPQPPSEREIELNKLLEVEQELNEIDARKEDLRLIRETSDRDVVKYANKLAKKLAPRLEKSSKKEAYHIKGLTLEESIEASLIKLINYTSQHLDESTNEDFSAALSDSIARELTLFFNHYRKAKEGGNLSNESLLAALSGISHPVTHEAQSKRDFLKGLSGKVAQSIFPKHERETQYAAIGQSLLPVLINFGLKRMSNHDQFSLMLGKALNSPHNLKTEGPLPESYRRLGVAIFKTFAPKDTDPQNFEGIGSSIGRAIYRRYHNMTAKELIFNGIKQEKKMSKVKKERIHNNLITGIKKTIFSHDLPESSFSKIIYWITHPNKWMTLYKINGSIWRSFPTERNMNYAAHTVVNKIFEERKKASWEVLRYRLLSMFGEYFNLPWEEHEASY